MGGQSQYPQLALLQTSGRGYRGRGLMGGQSQHPQPALLQTSGRGLMGAGPKGEPITAFSTGDANDGWPWPKGGGACGRVLLVSAATAVLSPLPPLAVSALGCT